MLTWGAELDRVDIHNYKRRLELIIRSVKEASTCDENKRLILKFGDRCLAEGLSLARVEHLLRLLKVLAEMLAKATRRKMISILEHTEPEDWLFRSVGHFDGQVDGWVYDREGWREATPELINWIIRQLRQFDYTIYYLAKDRDSCGNKVEPNTFEIFDIAIHSLRLKPKDGIICF